MVGGRRRAEILAVVVAGTVAATVVKVLKCRWKDSRRIIKGFRMVFVLNIFFFSF